jgi:hypothetical protein
MDELVQWLGKQIDEDERIAKAQRGVFPSPGVDDDGAVWLHVRPGGNAVIVRYRDSVAGYDDMAKLRNWAGAENGWTQARVLAEIDAKRRILSDVLPTMRADEIRIAGEWGIGSGQVREASDDLLSLLALPYAGRPGYREEWRP